jgi:hypothetical protein
MSWEAAGTFVWHADAVDPTLLGRELRSNGFGWAVVFVNDGTSEAPVDPVWIERFRRASGLPLGGWGVLRDDPVHEADLARDLIRRYGLDFYVANAESAYEYSGANGPSGARSGRSRAFVDEFRQFEPDLPAGLASYCRPSRHDLDWKTWRRAGFVFLPEAYVNVLGPAVAPAVCVDAAGGFFPAGRIHPIVGMYEGTSGLGDAPTYARLLEQAGTVGFSVYLAEQGMTPQKWAEFGQAITTLGIAVVPKP